MIPKNNEKVISLERSIEQAVEKKKEKEGEGRGKKARTSIETTVSLCTVCVLSYFAVTYILYPRS